MFKFARSVPFLLVFMLIVSGCSSAQTGGDKKAPSSPAPAAVAVKFPQKPVRIIGTHPAGGAVDIPVRMLQPYLEKALGQPIVLEPKPGAGGTTAMEYVWAAQPDGYTLGTSLQTIIDGGKINPGASYDPVKFAPVASVVGKSYHIVVVRKDAPWKTFDDLVKDAKKTPGKIKYGGVGVGGDIVFGLTAARAANFNFIPYGGGGDMMKALLGSEIEVGTTSLGSYKSTAGDNTRVLAVLGDQRDPFVPDVPIAKEYGYDIVVNVANIVVAPPGTPPEILKILAKAFEQAIADPQYAQAVKNQFMTPWYLGGDDLQKWHVKANGDIVSVADAIKPKKK